MGDIDVDKLRKIFSQNNIWQGKTCPGIAEWYPTVEQMRSLYDEMVAHYAKTEVDETPYLAATMGLFPLMGDLPSLFDDIIMFCERELGFASVTENRQTVTRLQQERAERKKKEWAKKQESAREFFATLAKLKPPAKDSAERSRLEAKLADYNRDLGPLNDQPDKCRFVKSSDFRRGPTYRILIAQTVLSATEDVDLLTLAESQLQKNDGDFDAQEFYRSCYEISHYLRTPLVQGGEASVFPASNR